MKMTRNGRRWFGMRAAAVFALGVYAALTAAAAYSQPATSSTQDAAAKEKARMPDLDLSIWRSDLNKAARQAVYANKPMLLFFYRPGVSYSLNFAKAMRASPAVSKALLGWVCVSINEWDLRNQEINVKYHIELTPQVVMVSFDGVELGRQEDPINIEKFAKQLEQFGKPNITVTPDSPEVEQGKMPPSLRLVVADAANVSHKAASIAPIGGKKILEFVMGDPESEKKAGVELAGWGKVETKGGEQCRNTDQTGVGDKTGGFAYLKIPVQDQKAGYRIIFNIWGESYDPNSEDRTWLRWLRGKTGPKETDWIKYHFRRSEPLKVDRYNEIMFDFPPENLPIYGGSLFIGLGEGDQQIWVSKVELWYYGQAAPPKPE